MNPTGIVTFLTDFGEEDMYVGAMKGSLLSVIPTARVVDISHQVPPQAVRAGAFIGAAAWPYFPAGTVHVAVVDPDVGTDRPAIAVETGLGWFVGPDNGLFGGLLDEDLRPRVAGSVAVPAGMRVFRLENASLWRPAVSATFHGRDIFAPVAGHLAHGGPIESVGPRADVLWSLPAERAPADEAGGLRGSVIYVDHFGNLISNIRVEDLPAAASLSLAGRALAEGIVHAYAEIKHVAGLIGSEGYLEIAAPRGHAGRLLGAGAGAEVVVTPV